MSVPQSKRGGADDEHVEDFHLSDEQLESLRKSFGDSPSIDLGDILTVLKAAQIYFEEDDNADDTKFHAAMRAAFDPEGKGKVTFDDLVAQIPAFLVACLSLNLGAGGDGSGTGAPLAQEQLEQLAEVFGTHDGESTGTVSSSAMPAIIESLCGLEPGSIAASGGAQSFIDRFDPERSGSVSFDDFVAVAPSVVAEAAYGTVRGDAMECVVALIGSGAIRDAENAMAAVMVGGTVLVGRHVDGVTRNEGSGNEEAAATQASIETLALAKSSGEIARRVEPTQSGFACFHDISEAFAKSENSIFDAAAGAMCFTVLSNDEIKARGNNPSELNEEHVMRLCVAKFEEDVADPVVIHVEL